MQPTTRITFTFTGGIADRHWLDGSDAVRYTESTRQLIALHAFFYTTATVPNGGALNHTRHYRVYKAAPQAQCYADPWLVTIVGGVVAGLTATYGARAIDYTYAHFMKDSLGPIIQGKPSSMPREIRGEPVLSAQDRLNEAVFDTEREREYRWQRLRERATLILPQAARPVGRCATKLVITANDLEVGMIDLDALRRMQACKEAAITSALDSLQLRSRPL